MKNLQSTYYDSLMSEYETFGIHMIWEMKDGTDIEIKDMKTSHIQNCINMLHRNWENETKNAWIDIFNDVLIKRRGSKINKLLENIYGRNK